MDIGYRNPDTLLETLQHSDLSDMPDIGGTNSDHDSRYYTETEIDTLLGGYIRADGTIPLTADWDAGNFRITVQDLTADHVQYTLGLSAPTHSEGLTYWDDDDKTLNLMTEVDGTTIQTGQEMVVRCTNKTGVQIDNGDVVYVSGAQGSRPTIALADAGAGATSDATIGVVTADIADNATGYVTTFGLVRGLDTSAFTAGDVLYISSTAGALTNVKPVTPAHAVKVGTCLFSNNGSGIILVSVINGEHLGDLHDVLLTSEAANEGLFYNGTEWVNQLTTIDNLEANLKLIQEAWVGTFLEDFDFTISEAGGVITGSLEKDGGGDLTMVTTDGFSVLDCTSPICTVTLTAGTDDVPQLGHVYVLKSTGLLTYETSTYLEDWPSTEHIPVAIVYLRSAATTATDDGLVNQNINNRSLNKSNKGWIQLAGGNIRSQGPKWYTGVTPTITINTNGGSADDVYLATTSGIVRQFNPQTYAAADMGAGTDAHVVNDFTSPFKTVMNLNGELTDASNSSMSGKYFWLTFWGVQNSAGEENHLMVNLPPTSYNTQAQAQGSDLASSRVRSIPQFFGNTGFLISETLFRHQSASGGTWTEVESNVLLGTDAGGGGGSTPATPTTFADGSFAIYDTTDPTRILNIQADQITAGNTRTLTIPDKDGTIALTSDTAGAGAAKRYSRLLMGG